MKNNDKNNIQDENLKKGKVAIEDQVIRLFDDVLEVGEVIQKGYKPNKAKFAFSRVIIDLLFVLVVGAIILGLWFDSEIVYKEKIVGTCVAGGALFSLTLLVMWFSILCYKNTFYVYTNKRIIIRTGIFGVDYHSLDLKNIGASDVCVTFLDKIIRKNTGSIKFGSNSSPIANSYYNFANIENPYQVYKEIKEYIQSIQDKDE